MLRGEFLRGIGSDFRANSDCGGQQPARGGNVAQRDDHRQAMEPFETLPLSRISGGVNGGHQKLASQQRRERHNQQ